MTELSSQFLTACRVRPQAFYADVDVDIMLSGKRLKFGGLPSGCVTVKGMMARC
jgi:hypothetical protein